MPRCEFLHNLPCEQVSERIAALEDENAKLRELMHDMLRWMPCPTHCYHCERYHYPEGCEFEIRRRELGIEVV